jgi:uncharacterized protein
MPKGDKFYFQASKEIKRERPNLKLVFELLSKASNLQNAKACYALATWYLHGEYVKKDLAKGFHFLELATQENISAAFYDIAVSFEKGKGTKKNLKLAFKNYIKASLLGDKQSIYEVGRCYFYGIGISRNIELSKIWLDAAEFWEVN